MALAIDAMMARNTYAIKISKLYPGRTPNMQTNW
jgi:hypothetical protein